MTAEVARVQMGYSIGWMTLSSLLNDYSDLYGPSSLLLMNIAYFLPSIPLLVVSSFCDDWLDNRFGAPLPHYSKAFYLTAIAVQVQNKPVAM